MLFENLRNVKKKWKVPALVVIIVLILGLLSSFAYLGSSFNTGTNSASTGDTLKDLAATAKAAAKAAKGSDDAENVLAAANAYYNLAVYQQLYNEGDKSAESYQQMKDYADKVLKLYGSVETTDAQWQEAYLLLMRGDIATDDLEGARAHFQDSLKVTTPSSSYLQTYAGLLYTAKEYQAIIDDLNDAIKVLEPLAADAEEAEDEEDEAEDGEDSTEEETSESTEETPSDIISTANMLIQSAQSLLTPADDAENEE